MRLAALALVLFVLGLLNDQPWRGWRDRPQVDFRFEPIRVAKSLVEGRGFADPFLALPTGPTAHVAPVFPALQAVLLKAFGYGTAGWIAIRAIPVVALSLQYALLPVFAHRLGISIWTGALAAMFGLLTKPGRAEYGEAHLAGLAGLILVAVALEWRKRVTVRGAWLLGAYTGLVALLHQVLLLPYIVWLLIEARSISWRRVTPLFIAPAMVCLPWIVRNYNALGAPLAIRDNLGIELNITYNDCMPYGLAEALDNGCIRSHHPHENLMEAQAVASMGEYRYNKDRQATALEWIATHPQRSLQLAAQHTWYFWFPSDYGFAGYLRQRWRDVLLHPLTLLSFAGLYLMHRRRIPASKFLILIAAVFPVIYYVLHYTPRYRYPILWITWLGAAYALSATLGALRSRASSTSW